MTESLAEKATHSEDEVGIVDCDIHNMVPSAEALKPYLSERWQKHQELIGSRGHRGFLKYNIYPKVSEYAARVDARPPSGLPPGSDLSFMRKQLLDPMNLEYGILNTLHPGAGDEINGDWAAALSRAVNDWQIEEWLEKEPRLRASMIVPYENAEFAAEEIDRLGDHPSFVQVLFVVRTKEPLGNKRYWKMYEAAERHGLPVGIHFGGMGGQATTSSGWPSYYIEDHTVMSMAFQSQVISLVFEGVFERFPSLRIVLLEGGFAWLPPLMWRMDKHWKRLKEEVPHLKRAPSEYVKEHMWVTTQPMEEPPDPKQLLPVIAHLEDRLMFATDYPHWDYDEPDRAFQMRLPADLKRKIYSENARALYSF